MAQTRRIGKHSEKAYLLSAPRFSPYRSGQITPIDHFVHSPVSPCRLVKLTRMGGCRIPLGIQFGATEKLTRSYAIDAVIRLGGQSSFFSSGPDGSNSAWQTTATAVFSGEAVAQESLARSPRKSATKKSIALKVRSNPAGETPYGSRLVTRFQR